MMFFRLRIRASNIVILFLAIGLSNFLVSTPTTTLLDHLVTTGVAVVTYGAGWRYWVLTAVRVKKEMEEKLRRSATERTAE